MGSNWLAETGAKLPCLSIPRNPKVRQTVMGDPREPRLDESWVRKCVRMGRCHGRGGGCTLLDWQPLIGTSLGS